MRMRVMNQSAVMPEEVRQDILKILHRVIKVLEKGYYNQLKALSNHSIHNASIFQDQDSISIAVITYAMSKIVDTPSFDLGAFRTAFKNSIKDLRAGKFEVYRSSIKALFKMIMDTDQKLKQYIDLVIDFAEVKKGGKIYDHGISLAQTASLLGVTQWELMEYLGTTTIEDHFREETSVEKRLQTARKLFGLK